MKASPTADVAQEIERQVTRVVSRMRRRCRIDAADAHQDGWIGALQALPAYDPFHPGACRFFETAAWRFIHRISHRSTVPVVHVDADVGSDPTDNVSAFADAVTLIGRQRLLAAFLSNDALERHRIKRRLNDANTRG